MDIEKEDVIYQFGFLLKDPEIDKEEMFDVLCNEIARQRMLAETYRESDARQRKIVFDVLTTLKDAWKNQAKPEQIRKTCDMLYGRFKGKYDDIGDWLVGKLI